MNWLNVHLKSSESDNFVRFQPTLLILHLKPMRNSDLFQTINKVQTLKAQVSYVFARLRR